MPQLSKRLLLVNSFGTLFYFGCMLQWLWASLPYLPGIILFLDAFQPATSPDATPLPTTPSEPPSIVLVVVMIAVTLIILGATAYVLAKLPATVGKSGQKFTRKASELVVPVVTRHAKISPQKRRRLTARIVLYIKLSLCLLPLALSAGVAYISFEITYDIVMLAATSLATLSLLLLLLQLVSAKLLKVSHSSLW